MLGGGQVGLGRQTPTPALLPRRTSSTRPSTMSSFLPLNLYEQFTLFNLYFLLIILLQVRWGQPQESVPMVTPLHPA